MVKKKKKSHTPPLNIEIKYNIHILYVVQRGYTVLALQLEHKIIFKPITFYIGNI